MDTKKVIVISAVGLVVICILGATFWVVQAYRSPLGPALQAGNSSTVQTENQGSVPAAQVSNQSMPTATPGNAQPTLTVVPDGTQIVSDAVQTGVCGETAVWNILVLGSDAAGLRGPKGSDLTRILRVDFPNKRVVMYSFPRDLWVDTTGLGLTNPTVNATRLGTVFFEARARSASANVVTAMVDGTSATARMLATNFLVSTDHYITVDLSQIPAMVDAVGGVPVNVPVAITDPWIGMTIPAGQQTLNGAQFASYARAIPDSDFSRIQRNTMLLAALQQRLLDPAVWVKLPQLYSQFKDSIATDLSPEQINHLTCLLQEVPKEAIQQDAVRQEWTSPGPQAGSLLWDKTKVINRLKELGLIP